ncbi:MAG: P-loop NTPase [Candidatus Methanospirareceae archaeon]
MDPRLCVVDKRLEGITRLIAVSGGKGGVGKSLAAAVIALMLSKSYKVGLLDLDLSAPSTHVILGIEGEKLHFKEDKGIIPAKVHGLEFMSIIYFTGNNPSPLRGVDISNVILELLATTRWSSLDFLIIDMPPGIGDAMMDIIRWVKRIEFVIMTNYSKIALETVRKVIMILKELEVPIIGVIENMKIKESVMVREEMRGLGVPFLGEISFDSGIEEAIGDVNKLLRSGFAKDMERVLPAILKD